MASPIRALHVHPSPIRIGSRTNRFSFSRFLPLKLMERGGHLPARRLFCRATSAPPVERAEEQKKGLSRKEGKILIRVHLKHQVEFGEHVGIIGSTEQLGSWEKQVELDWSPEGWICELELPGGTSIEYKFVIFRMGEKKKKWEDGSNRVLDLPVEGSFNMVCHWNKTGESPELVPISAEQVSMEAVKMEEEEEVGQAAVDEIVGMEEKIETSDSTKFGEEWKGRQISFMKSNEHRNREVERIWNWEGLEGAALELVKGDKDSRNWWRKVCLNLKEKLRFHFNRE